MSEFRYAVVKGNLRRVRTPEGARYFGLPIGSLITPGALRRAKSVALDPGRLADGPLPKEVREVLTPAEVEAFIRNARPVGGKRS